MRLEACEIWAYEQVFQPFNTLFLRVCKTRLKVKLRLNFHLASTQSVLFIIKLDLG